MADPPALQTGTRRAGARRLRRAAALVAAIGLGVATGCGGAEERDPRPAPEPPEPPSATGVPASPTPATAAPGEPPSGAPPLPPPDDIPRGDLRGDAAAGAQLYQVYCYACHGDGSKPGPAAPQEPRPANHTDSEYMGSLSDAHLFTVVSKGGASVGKSPLMTAWGAVLSDQQIRDLIAHMRALSGT